MFDAIDAKRVASISLAEKFRARFGNPYAVIHRADIHGALLEGVKATTDAIEFPPLRPRSCTSSRTTTA